MLKKIISVDKSISLSVEAITVSSYARKTLGA